MAETGSNQYMKRARPTVCWDCANACGGCSWSAKLEPVPGWQAEETQVSIQKGGILDSMRVTGCPQFRRDAYDKGQVRYSDAPKDTKIYKGIVYDGEKKIGSKTGGIIEVAKWADAIKQKCAGYTVNIEQVRKKKKK